MVKTESPAVTQTVWFGGSWGMNRSRPSGYHKACCFGTAIGGSNAQISQICAIAVQATSRLRTNERLTQKHTFLIHSFSVSTPAFSLNMLPFTEFHYSSLHTPLPSWYQNFEFITNSKFIIFICWTKASQTIKHLKSFQAWCLGFAVSFVSFCVNEM